MARLPRRSVIEPRPLHLRMDARRQLVRLLVERAMRDLQAHNALPGLAADQEPADARSTVRPLLHRQAERDLDR